MYSPFIFKMFIGKNNFGETKDPAEFLWKMAFGQMFRNFAKR